MSAKSQHNNILLAVMGFTLVVVVVGLIGFFTLGKQDETIQGEVELSIVTDEGEASAVFTFDDETQRIKVLPTSGMETPVDFCRKFAFKVSGAGIKKLVGVKLELRRVRE